jgi:lactoylglutathione lyase
MVQFNATGLFVKDLAAMVAFYRDVMGMETDWTEGPYASLQSGAARLMLYGRKDFEAMTARAYEYPAGFNGTLELAFDAGDPALVDEAYRRAVQAGASSVLPPTDEPWGMRCCYVADPDGNLIEIFGVIKI